MSVTRRRFLTGAATAAGVAAVSAAAPQIAQARVPVPTRWDYTYEVVILGYGGAGAAAAITAHDAGAKVVILEKMKEGGGNTAVSGGGLFQPNDFQKGLSYVKGLFNFSRSEMDENLIEMYTRNATNVVDWVKGLKADVNMTIYGHAGFNDLPGADSVDKFSIPGGAGGGQNLWAVYSHAVEQVRNIPVMLNTPAKRLITNNDGDVIGVIATQNNREITVKATKGVILATGGYEFNEKMLQNFAKGSPIYALGNPGNTGDGITMAVDVGAELWHMNGASCPIGMKVPGYQACPSFSMSSSPAVIYVDRQAKRFVNEKSIETHAGLLAVDFYDGHLTMYSRIPCYAIFDDKAVKANGAIGSSLGYFGLKEGYRWSRSNEAEIEKGWVTKANSIRELAQKLNIDPATLEQTVNKWNTDVKNGEDTLFHRDITNQADPSRAAYLNQYVRELSAPIEQGPFYAVALYPTLLNTQGGPRRDIEARVLNPYGEPIKRLYSAGELGSLWGIIYQGGGNNTESIVFGRVAGANVIKETPWG